MESSVDLSSVPVPSLDINRSVSIFAETSKLCALSCAAGSDLVCTPSDSSI